MKKLFVSKFYREAREINMRYVTDKEKIFVIYTQRFVQG